MYAYPKKWTWNPTPCSGYLYIHSNLGWIPNDGRSLPLLRTLVSRCADEPLPILQQDFPELLLQPIHLRPRIHRHLHHPPNARFFGSWVSHMIHSCLKKTFWVSSGRWVPSESCLEIKYGRFRQLCFRFFWEGTWHTWDPICLNQIRSLARP